MVSKTTYDHSVPSYNKKLLQAALETDFQQSEVEDVIFNFQSNVVKN